MREYDSFHSGNNNQRPIFIFLFNVMIYFSMKEADLLYEKYTNPEKENIMD